MLVAIIIALLVLGYLVFMYVNNWKYEYLPEKQEDGSWEMIAVCHACGEEIDDEFKKLWHERMKQYELEYKKINH